MFQFMHSTSTRRTQTTIKIGLVEELTPNDFQNLKENSCPKTHLR